MEDEGGGEGMSLGAPFGEYQTGRERKRDSFFSDQRS